LINSQQKSAISHILQNFCSPIPYILYGPPGTGKTSTLIELINQVNILRKSFRVLIAAPSNTAVDVICMRLQNFTKEELIRFNSHQRDINLVHQGLSLFFYIYIFLIILIIP
jgi:Cdc6-like AAA superfamily ATPase